MARRKKHSSDQRDDPPIASEAADQALPRAVPVTSLEDRRQFTPTPEIAHAKSHIASDLRLSTPLINHVRQIAIKYKPLLSAVPNRHRTFRKKSLLRTVRSVPRAIRKNAQALRGDFKFQIPKDVAICVRRKQRREYIFASGRSGRVSRTKKRRRNEHSNIRCK